MAGAIMPPHLYRPANSLRRRRNHEMVPMASLSRLMVGAAAALLAALSMWAFTQQAMTKGDVRISAGSFGNIGDEDGSGIPSPMVPQSQRRNSRAAT